MRIHEGKAEVIMTIKEIVGEEKNLKEYCEDYSEGEVKDA